MVRSPPDDAETTEDDPDLSLPDDWTARHARLTPRKDGKLVRDDSREEWADRHSRTRRPN